MKLTDLIVKHFSSDKVMHFLGGAWITALTTPFGWWGILIGVIFTLLLSFAKEQWLDENFDWYDILSAFIGCISTIIIYLIIIFLL